LQAAISNPQNRVTKQKQAPSPKYITVACKQKTYKLTKAATLSSITWRAPPKNGLNALFWIICSVSAQEIDFNHAKNNWM